MKIRKAKVSDIPALMRLYKNMHELADYAGMKHDKNYFLAYMNKKNRVTYVYESDTKLCGAMVVEFEPKVYTWLYTVVVDQKYRGKGVGKTLMAFLEKESEKRKAKRILFLVYEWNKRMRNIVEHYQYRPGKKLLIYSKKIL
jgi:ribosomal protein S18 acetylase RimI-like enzyme